MALPAPRPHPRKGEHAKAFARRALDYGDANRAKLLDAHDAYGEVRDSMAGP